MLHADAAGSEAPDLPRRRCVCHQSERRTRMLLFPPCQRTASSFAFASTSTVIVRVREHSGTSAGVSRGRTGRARGIQRIPDKHSQAPP